jgi:hypothetical protein
VPYKNPKDAQPRNTERRRLDRQKNREEHTQKNRDWNLRRRHGITLDQYNSMRASQNYRCAVCGLHENDLPRPPGKRTTDGIQVSMAALAVDHCHVSGKIRKLLCHKCNQGLGCFKDDPEILAAAIRYLAGHSD